MDRDQLAARLQEAGFDAVGLRLAYLIMYAEAGSILVSGAPVRSPGGALKQTYALFAERVPPAAATPASRDEALGRLARRYFTSRGPATLKDCAGWSGLTVTEVRRGLHVAQDTHPDALAAMVMDGVAYCFDAAAEATGTAAGTEASAARVPAGTGPRIDLIECYDEYVMGYFPTRHYLGGTAPALPAAGAPVHVVLLDGRKAGSWRHTMFPARCELDIRLFLATEVPAGSARAQAVDGAVQDAVDRYGSFLGVPTALVHTGVKLEGHN